ncbi:MAG: sel1 repeat family protein [Erysipelotrichaceae bacterium]|nr:sel1 repeat family protein [Erysipelotrichaceae bacterium]
MKRLQTIEEARDWFFTVSDSGESLDMDSLEDTESLAFSVGDGGLLNDIGACYFEGKGVKQDQERAVELYQKGTAFGDMTAASNLGFCYYYGNGTKKDLMKAFLTFSKAERLGSLEAEYMLGDMYLKGEIVEKDVATAFCSYQKLYQYLLRYEDNGEEDREYQQLMSAVSKRLARCYHYGWGTMEDKDKAEYLLAKAVFFYRKRLKWGDYYASEGYEEAMGMMGEWREAR